MNELQSKIYTLKIVHFLFKIFLVITCVLFLIFGFRDLQKELILAFLTAFNFVASRVCEYYISVYQKQYKSQVKNKKKAKIIYFDKIA